MLKVDDASDLALTREALYRTLSLERAGVRRWPASSGRARSV